MTTIFEELRRQYGSASAEQKLHILRRELLRPIVTVESSAHLLQAVHLSFTNRGVVLIVTSKFPSEPLIFSTSASVWMVTFPLFLIRLYWISRPQFGGHIFQKYLFSWVTRPPR